MAWLFRKFKQWGVWQDANWGLGLVNKGIIFLFMIFSFAQQYGKLVVLLRTKPYILVAWMWRIFYLIFKQQGKHRWFCRLIWIICSEADMQKVEKVHYKTLQIVWNNYMATFGDLLTLNNELKIHQKHLRLRAVQIYQSRNKPNPRFKWKVCKGNPSLGPSHIWVLR